MITLLNGFPDDVVALRADGQVSMADYDTVLIPAVEDVLSRHDKVKIYYEFAAGFTGMDLGAMVEDARVGFGHLGAWKRIALVTDVDWLRHAADLFHFLIPAETRVFALAQAAEAQTWIAEKSA